MSTAVQDTSQATETRSESAAISLGTNQITIWDWLDSALAILALGLAIVAGLVYFAEAIEFRERPFIGATVDEDLSVRGESSFVEMERQDSDDLEYWPALAAGVEEDDVIAGINRMEFDSTAGLAAFQADLSEREQGTRVLLNVTREGRNVPNNGRWENCVPVRENGITCQIQVTLARFPLMDMVGHFGVGFVIGVLMIIIGAYVYLARPLVRIHKLFAVLSSSFAVILMGNFDTFTSYEYIYMWLAGGCFTTAALVTFSLEFPGEMTILERWPALRYLPFVIAGAVVYPLNKLYQDDAELGTILPAAMIIAGAGVLIGVMGWRRQYTFSPVLREQASYVLIGAIASFVPLAILVFTEHVLSVHIPTGIATGTQIVAILFVLSTAYAIVQSRLLETDRLIPSVLVYGILGGALMVSYAAVVIGLSQIGIKSIEAESPIIVSLFVLVLIFAFAPVNNLVRGYIDTLMFRRRREFQTRFETFMNQLTEAININDVEHALREQLEDTLAPNEIVMYVRDTETQVFRARPHPETGEQITDVNFTLDSGLAHYLSQEASVLYLQPGKSLPPTLYADRGRLAVLNMPIWVRLKGQRHLNGFLGIDERRDGTSYSYEELRFIERIADQVALALERAQIVEDLEQRFRVQDVLSQVSRALNFAIDLDTMMELVYAQTIRVIESDIFSIAILDSASNEMYYAFFAQGDERLSHMEGRRWMMGRDLVSEVARSRRGIVAEDYLVELRRYDPNSKPQYPDIKAWMAVPLTTAQANETLGVMVIGSSDPNVQYTDEQRNLFMDIANLASNAIDKTRLFQATQTRTEQLEALNAISSQLSFEIEDVDRLLDLITRSAIDILRVEAGSLLLVDEENNDLIFRVALGPTAQEVIGKRIPLDTQSLSAEAIHREKPIIVNDTSTDSRWHGEIVSDDDEEDSDEKPFSSRAILTVPLLSQGAPIGALQMINKKDGRNFTEDDAQLLTTFAAQAAVAIQNARLFASQDEQLLQRVEELDRMAAIDQSLNQSLELTRVVEITLDWAIRQSGASAGMIGIVDEEQDVLYVVGSNGYEEGSIFYETFGTPLSMDKGIWRRVIQSGTAVFSRNLSTDPDYIESLPNAAAQVVVPIISASDVIGVVLVESEQEEDLTLLDMQFLSRLADHASPALTNAQLFEQLNEQQEQRAEFVSFIAHELKAPMTSMRGYTDLLMRGVVGPVNDQQSDFLKTIYNAVTRMDGLVSDLRDIETYEAGRMRLDMAEVSMNNVIEESLGALQQQFDDKQQQITIKVPDSLPAVWGDERRLVQIMTNLLTNANKYTPENGQVSLRCEATINEWDTEGVRRVLHIEVEDTGIGMSEEDQKRLFREKYFRTENPKALDQPGTGLGLVLTRGLVLQHGGQIWLESEIEAGTTFHFTVPLAEEIMRQAM